MGNSKFTQARSSVEIAGIGQIFNLAGINLYSSRQNQNLKRILPYSVRRQSTRIRLNGLEIFKFKRTA